jgi:hypothetical protein
LCAFASCYGKSIVNEKPIDFEFDENRLDERRLAVDWFRNNEMFRRNFMIIRSFYEQMEKFQEDEEERFKKKET